MQRHGDKEWHGELAEWAASYSHVVDKNQERYLGSEQSQPQTRQSNPGSQHKEYKSP